MAVVSSNRVRGQYVVVVETRSRGRTPFREIAGTALPIDDRYILLMGTSDFPTVCVGKSRENIGIAVKGNGSDKFFRG